MARINQEACRIINTTDNKESCMIEEIDDALNTIEWCW